MDDYRDEMAALHARIGELERELVDAKTAKHSDSMRCPHCGRKMLAGTLTTRDRSSGHKTDVILLDFCPQDGAAVKTVDRAVAHDSDGFCEDCSTVVVKGRFAE